MKAKRLVLQIYSKAELRQTSKNKFSVVCKYFLSFDSIPIDRRPAGRWIGTRILSENAPSEHQAWKDAWKECQREMVEKLSR